MVVEPLRSQHLCKLALLPRALLDLGALVLKPDLDLVVIEPQLVGQILPPLLGEIPVIVKLPLEPAQLLRAKGRPRPLLRRRR